jgi:hypothetical protein
MKRTVLLLCTCVAWPAAAQVGDLLFRDGYEPTAQISIAPTPSFQPQLAGTSSAPLTLTITNTGGLPVTLTEIGSSGTDASSFVLDLGATQLSLAPAASTTLTITFEPSLPWQPGTREAELGVARQLLGWCGLSPGERPGRHLRRRRAGLLLGLRRQRWRWP